MSPSIADLNALSRLLDLALDLEPAQLPNWLASLPPEHRHLRLQLQDMLASHSSGSRSEFMAQAPRLAQLAGDEAPGRAGERIGPYSLIREIGRGGMGSVWLAARADGSYKREVALKFPRLAWGAGLMERMARERQIGALLEHPNIARLYDAGVDDCGRPFLALEFINGQPIDAWCEAQGLGVAARLRLFLQVSCAVAYAHARLVVHRDLKPSNVLVTRDGQAHLLDFGIAKLLDEGGSGSSRITQEHGRVMTPHYASPEQVGGEPITVASDVYSLGALLYELLTGTLPITPRRGTLGAVEDAILQGDPPPASSRVKDRATARLLRGELDAILAKALQRKPEHRYATADALTQDIERHLRGETVLARPDSAAYRLRKALRRHWVGASALAAVLTAMLIGSGIAVMHAQRAARSAERERLVKEFVADVFRINSRMDPNNAALRPASPQALLEGGAQLIQQRFSGQPGLQAELYGVVGGVFSDMGAYRLASDYAARRIEALALLPSDRNEHAKALLSLAQALFDDRRFGDAEPRIRQARELSTGDSALTLDATLLLARLQLQTDRRTEAASTLAEAEPMLVRQGAKARIARAWTTFLQASQMANRNQLDEAVPVFQQAIETALANEGLLSRTAVEIRLSVARRLAQTRHADQARMHFEAATSALRKLGGAHEVRAAFAAAQFAERRRLGGRQSTAAEAMAALEDSRAFLLASQLPIPGEWIPQIDFWLGAVKADHGDIAGGVPLMEINAPVLRANFESASGRLLIAIELGVALKHAGRHDAADKLLREARATREKLGMTTHPSAAYDFLFMASNLLMQGRHREALAKLDEAPRFDSMRGEGGYPDRRGRVLLWSRAQVHLAQGAAAGALALLERSAPGADELKDDLAHYRPLLGEALCASKRTAEGLAILKLQLMQDEQAGDHPQAPWLARLRAVAGQCALDAGDRKASRAYADKARTAFAAQPGVSPYYKAPLFTLEHALGLRRLAI